jgi:FixJ family two-component response regulator
MKMAEDSTVRPTILIVDDDPAVRNSLVFLLSVEGYAVRSYPNAEAILDHDDFPVQGCIVIDYRLPGMNGLELLDELRRRKVTLPAFIIASHPTDLLMTKAAAAGIPLIEKPLLDETLREKIRAATGLS